MAITVEEIQKKISDLLEINNTVLCNISVEELGEIEHKLQIMFRINSLLYYMKPPLNVPVMHPQDYPSIDGHQNDREENNRSFSESENKNLMESQTFLSTTEQMFSEALKRSLDREKERATVPPLSTNSTASTDVSLEPAVSAASEPSEETENSKESKESEECQYCEQNKHADETLQLLDVDRKTSEESQETLKHSDSTPSVQELLFSKALMRSIKRDKKESGIPDAVAGPVVASSAGASSSTKERAVLTIGQPDDEMPEDIRDAYLERPETPRTEYRTISLSTSSPKG